MKRLVILLNGLLFLVLVGCCKKEKDPCIEPQIQVSAFQEKFSVFECYDSTERNLVLRSKAEIDSLSPLCEFVTPIAFPVDEIDMAYIIFGKMSYYRRDTFETALCKDTCNKKLTYDVKMIQRTDSSLGSFAWPLYMFCSVENIPADYQVEVKYKYVPIQ